MSGTQNERFDFVFGKLHSGFHVEDCLEKDHGSVGWLTGNPSVSL